jgi:exopolysaccharide biosynthesis polyprenyl glycosylphosphotransferase
LTKYRQFASAMLVLLRGLAYVSQLAAFMLLLSITNPQLLRISRTTAITLSSFSMLMIVFVRIYGGYRIGEQKSRPIIYQMALSVLLTDMITYIQLEIMNVNAANNDSLELFGVDLLMLGAAFAVQVLCIIACTYLGNYFYFRIHKPSRCCVVTASKADEELICSKIRIFKKQFAIRDCVDVRDPQLHDKIRRNQTIMLFHLPPAAHQELIEYCYKSRKVIYFDLSIGDILAQNSGSFMLDDVVMTAHTRDGLTVRQRFFKRALDIVLSLAGLVLTSPVMAVTAIAIKLDDHGPVIYTQKRLTRGDRIFEIYKFRTMKVHDDVREYSALRDDDRITRVGKVLRRLRIDELPQLVNILKGEMSVVGPRPEMLSNVDKYLVDLPEYAYRCRVKAGLTGYAQIAGKYNTTPREKLMMDISYIENYSFWLDIKLILKTITVFFKRDSTEAFVSDPQQKKSDEAV